MKPCNSYIKYSSICGLHDPQLVLYIPYLLTINKMWFNIFPKLNIPICKLFLATFAQNKMLCMIYIVHKKLQIFFVFQTLNYCSNIYSSVF